MLIQIIGSLIVLAAFAGNQLGWLSSKSPSYLVGNIMGSGILAIDAAFEHQWGFLLLEGTWSFVSLISFISPILRRGNRETVHHISES